MRKSSVYMIVYFYGMGLGTRVVDACYDVLLCVHTIQRFYSKSTM